MEWKTCHNIGFKNLTYKRTKRGGNSKSFGRGLVAFFTRFLPFYDLIIVFVTVIEFDRFYVVSF